MGTRHFLIMYFLSGVLGGLFYLMLPSRGVPCVGASGAIFGIIGAFAALYPHRQITLLLFFVFPVTMKAWILAAAFALLQLLFFVSGGGGNIAYSVHLAGIAAGYVYALVVFRPEMIARLRARFRPRPKHLRMMHKEPPVDSASPDDVDAILDKIAAKGISSLTKRERAILDEASKRR